MIREGFYLDFFVYIGMDNQKIYFKKFNVDKSFFDGLKDLNNLKTLGEQRIKRDLMFRPDFGAPLCRLYDLVKDRIVNGLDCGKVLTGRDRNLPFALEKLVYECVDSGISGDNAKGSVENTDLSHTIACLDYANKFVNDLRRLVSLKFSDESFVFSQSSEKILLSSLIVHDSAYPKVDSYKQFTGPNTRKIHIENASIDF